MEKVLIVVGLIAGCTTESPTEQFCKRADSCNLLTTSVDECTQDLDSEIAQLPQSKQQELEYDVQQCLDHPSCDGFAQCVQNLGSGSGN